MFEAQAGSAQVDFVAGAELFAAAVAGWDFDGAAVAEDARAEFAFVVAETVIALVQADVGVAARYRRVGFVGAFFEDDVVAADHAVLRVGQLRQAADVGARFFQQVFGAIGLALQYG